jgi:hypothetical protein
MYSSNGNSTNYERVTPVPQGWNYEDPIGDELSGRGSKPSNTSSRNRPVPIPQVNAAPTEQYADDYDLLPPDYDVAPTMEVIRDGQRKANPVISKPIPRIRDDQNDVTVKNIKINLEINIKINLV